MAFISLLIALILSLVSPAPSVQTYEAMGALELHALGINPKLATLAPVQMVDKDSPFGGAYWKLDGPCAVGVIGAPGTIDLVDYTPGEYSRSITGALLHEQTHALEDRMTDSQRDELTHLMADNPTVASRMGYAAYEYHPGELTRYIDQLYGTTLMEAGMPLDEATKREVMAAEDAAPFAIPQPIVDFINPIIANVETSTGGGCLQVHTD